MTSASPPPSDTPPPPTATASPEDSARPVLHDSTRPPRWFARGLVMVVVAFFVAVFVWTAAGALSGLAVNILIAFFIALALEPLTVWLVRHGWKRGAAAITSLVGSLVVVLTMFALFGNLFVQQLVQLVQTIPDLYTDVQAFLADRFDIDIPATEDLLRQGFEEFGNDVASGALIVGTTIVGGIFAFLTIMLVTYYLLAAGPRFRAAVCAWLTPNRQTEVLRLWEVTQVKVSDFISSRIALAALSSAFTFVFLLILGTPYALPLAVFTGVVSQFIPTIGTYIGGALPIVVALTSQGPAQGAATLIFIVAYQQLENLYFSPKISARALEMNPAVSFVVVLAFGAVFGALGAFLALPIAATVQAVASTYLQRHELVDSHMLHAPARAPAGKAAGDDESRLTRRRRANRRATREAARIVDERREEGVE